MNAVRQESSNSLGVAGAAPSGSLRIMTFGWASVADMQPQGLAITYRFTASPAGEPYTVTITFGGRRVGARRKPGPRDSFTAVESLKVVPGSGPIAVTVRINDIAPGQWHVSAAPTRNGHRSGSLTQGKTRRVDLPTASATGRTTYAPVARILAPGAHLGAWPALVGAGVIVALAVQALLTSHVRLGVPRVVLVSLVASVVGLVGAKLYYATGHYIAGERGAFNLLSGSCIQGFVLGAVAALAVGARVADLPLGVLLDVTAPGLMFGMTIGRYGCFFGGCCAGRPTASRWGLWSSDRRVGVRRIPTQLFESAMALVVGLTAFLLVWLATPRPTGVVFVGAIAAYTLGRQLLFPLREGPRHTPHGRLLMLVLSVMALTADVIVGVGIR